MNAVTSDAARPSATPRATPTADVTAVAAGVTAVVVTWNRRDLLARSLTAVLTQNPAPRQVVVVDNASTDDTRGLVADHFPTVDLVRLERNTGGAGGFALGIARALDLGAQAIWIMDDDTIPQPGALAALLSARADLTARAGDGQPPVLLASRVEWVDGRAHPMNTPRAKPFASAAERELAASAGCVPVRTASFVSLLLDADRVREVGLPVADFFLWNDDFEYTARLLRDHRGVLCPASVVRHETKVFGASEADPGPRFYHEVRNKVWTFTRSSALAPGEKVVYAASSLRRWVRTFAASTDRATLADGLRRGLRDGLRAGPRPTTAVLKDAQPSVLPTVFGPLGLAAPPAGNKEGRSAPEPFSVLLPVYFRDDVAAFTRSFRSVTADQERTPDEVVVVVDGPLEADLDAAVEACAAASQVPTEILRLPNNVGLARALNAGLDQCAHDIVARQDADDASMPTRFALQVPVIESGADLVGSALVEFDEDPDQPGRLRVPPLTPEDIGRGARWAQPVFHPTIVYRRSVVEAAGGYQDLPLLEDYWLFARMLHHGARFANLPEPLVAYRVGEGAYARRGGRGILAAELELQRRLHRIGFTSPAQFVRNTTIRGGYRLVPEPLRRTAYGRLLARRDR